MSKGEIHSPSLEGVGFMGFPFQGGCHYPLRGFFNKPDKGSKSDAPDEGFFNNPIGAPFLAK